MSAPQSNTTTLLGIPASLGEPPAIVSGARGGWTSDISEVARDLVEHWQLGYYIVLRDIRIRYKQAAMGFGWALLMPIMIIAAGLIIQLVLARGSGQPLSMSAVAGTAVKSLPWAFFVGSVQVATNSLTSNMNLVSKVFFPREVLPISAVFAQGFDSAIGAVTLLVALPFMGVRFSSGLLWIPLLVMLLVTLTLAAALFLSCANLFYRDVKYLVQLLLTFGIFFTPVLFEPSMLGSLGARLVLLNPLAIILEGLRLAIVDGRNLLAPVDVVRHGVHIQAWAPWYLAYAGTWAIVGLAGSLVMFRRLQFLFAEYI